VNASDIAGLARGSANLTRTRRTEIPFASPRRDAHELLDPALRSKQRMNIDLVQQVLAALERERVRYVVFGAVALALHGLPRATEDLDLFVDPDRDNIERMKDALRSVFHDPHIDEISADDLLGEYPAVQYGPPEGPFHIDILTRLGERFDFASLESERVPFGDVSVPVVTPRMLFRMKRDTVRPKDHVDAARIAKRFGLGEG
jgi:hypothetical protein